MLAHKVITADKEFDALGEKEGKDIWEGKRNTDKQKPVDKWWEDWEDQNKRKENGEMW